MKKHPQMGRADALVSVHYCRAFPSAPLVKQMRTKTPLQSKANVKTFNIKFQRCCFLSLLLQRFFVFVLSDSTLVALLLAKYLLVSDFCILGKSFGASYHRESNYHHLSSSAKFSCQPLNPNYRICEYYPTEYLSKSCCV